MSNKEKHSYLPIYSNWDEWLFNNPGCLTCQLSYPTTFELICAPTNTQSSNSVSRVYLIRLFMPTMILLDCFIWSTCSKVKCQKFIFTVTTIAAQNLKPTLGRKWIPLRDRIKNWWKPSNSWKPWFYYPWFDVQKMI